MSGDHVKYTTSEDTTLCIHDPEGRNRFPVRPPTPHSHQVRESRRANVYHSAATGRKKINQYEVIEEIVRGAHSKVKLARDTGSGENVVIKVVPRFSERRNLASHTAPHSFKEVTILRDIRHPNVVALLEVIDDPKRNKIYLVLEHVEFGGIPWRKRGNSYVGELEQRRIQHEIHTKESKQDETNKLEFSTSGNLVPASCSHRLAVYKGYLMNRWPFTIFTATTRNRAARRDDPKPSANSDSCRARSTSIPDTSTLYRSGDDERSQKPPASGYFPSQGVSIHSELVADETVAERYSFVPCLTLDQTRIVLKDTIQGLEYLHDHGIVHRDIKPSNLLFSKDHRVKICDFGVSYRGEPNAHKIPPREQGCYAIFFDNETELRKTVGTPAFIAPELCSTSLDNVCPPVSSQIDVWSLGVTLYCLVFARLPFTAEGLFQIFKKIATEDVYIPRRRLRPVPPSAIPLSTTANQYRNENDVEYEDIDAHLVNLLQRMLRRDPEKRIQLRDIKLHPWVE